MLANILLNHQKIDLICIHTVKFGQLLVRTDANGKSTYYVYGKGLISEESESGYRIYHYDLRGSTVALTNQSGKVTDRCTYGTYGEVVSHTGSSDTPFLYDGRDGVMTDGNGLYYMRARYYSPLLMRFINSDPVDGNVKDSRTLNKYAYANGNPVSYTDPFGTSADNWGNGANSQISDYLESPSNVYGSVISGLDVGVGASVNSAINYLQSAERPNNIGKGLFNKSIAEQIEETAQFGERASKMLKYTGYGAALIDAGIGINENIQNHASTKKIVIDAAVDTAVTAGSIWASGAAGASIGVLVGSVVPVAGNIVGATIGFAIGVGSYALTDMVKINGMSVRGWIKNDAYQLFGN